MTALDTTQLSRRTLLKGGGALVVGFALVGPRVLAQSEEASITDRGGPTPGSLSGTPLLDSWIRIGADDSITVFTGKAELGQGIRTALVQVAAEQLQVAPARVALETADTASTPNEGYTAASHSMEESGTAIMHAAADTRAILLAAAAEKFGVALEQLQIENGVVRSGEHSIGYGALAADIDLHVAAAGQGEPIAAHRHRVMGQSLARLDIPAKVFGEPAYVQDMRPEGMVHARVVRPPVYGAHLASLDTAQVEAMPGVQRIIRDGDYLAVVAAGEYQAIQAMRALAKAARWEGGATLPAERPIADVLKSLDARGQNAAAPGTGKRLRATYVRPYQMHASLGPSCALAHEVDGQLTVWSHTQGAYPDRAAIAEMLDMSLDHVRVVHIEGAGCYGHNGADDAAADAALIAHRMPGIPVRVQWMREDEHRWEPYGSAMVVEAEAEITDDGAVADWAYDLWSTPHVTRPGPARPATCCRHVLSTSHSNRPHPSTCHSPPVPPIATRYRPTLSSARVSPSISFARCRCACRRCGHSART